MDYHNTLITWLDPKTISNSIRVGINAVKGGTQDSIGNIDQDLVELVNNLKIDTLRKWKGSTPPTSTRIGGAFLTLIWILLQYGILPYRKREDVFVWLNTILNSIDSEHANLNFDHFDELVVNFANSIRIESDIYCISQNLKDCRQPTLNEVHETLLELFNSQSNVSNSDQIFVGRQDDIYRIKTNLGLFNPQDGIAITVIQGWPGMGKTALTRILIQDTAIRAHFDHVLWMSLGPQGNLLYEISRWAKQLGDYTIASLNSLSIMKDAMRDLLRGQHVLIIGDDIWTDEHRYILLDIIDTQSNKILITTRFNDIATPISIHRNNVDSYALKGLNESESLHLLSVLAPKVTEEYSNNMPHLTEALEGLPLALQVAGRLLKVYHHRHLDIYRLLDELINSYKLISAKAPDDRFDVDTGQTPTISLLFQRSVETLSEAEQEAFALLGLFPHKPITFDQGYLTSVWETSDPQNLIGILIDRGLLESLESNSTEQYYLHRTLYMYANHLLDTHEKLGHFGFE